jgi:nicotinamide mononucleotide transporter
MDSLLQAAEPLFAVAFTLWGSPATWLEVAAFVLAVWMVACNLRVNPLAWPLAILSSVLYGLLFLHSRLYGEAGLQVMFVVAACCGWWQWLRGRAQDGAALRVHRLTRRQRLMTLAFIFGAWPLLAALLQRFTDSDVAYLDALPTVASLAGQVLLGRKAIENWAVWLAVNVFSVGLFALKGLWLTVALYALFAVLSVVGWRAWAALEGRVDARHAHGG